MRQIGRGALAEEPAPALFRWLQLTANPASLEGRCFRIAIRNRRVPGTACLADASSLRNLMMMCCFKPTLFGERRTSRAAYTWIGYLSVRALSCRLRTGSICSKHVEVARCV